MEQFTQAIIDIFAWFLQPFAWILAINWAVSLFRKD